MNFYKKYLKYKNKYLSLKGGVFQIRTSFLEKIENIIEHIKNINYTRVIYHDSFDSRIVINRLIFNILLYSGFIFRKETINDGKYSLDKKLEYELINNNGLFSYVCRIHKILNNHYIFNTSNLTNISCEIKRILDLLIKYSNYYYDNYPEIFNYNNDIIPEKSVEEYNMNDLFCLLFMIIKCDSESNKYFCILKKITHIEILNKDYIHFNLKIKYNDFYQKFNKDIINSYVMGTDKIFNVDTKIDTEINGEYEKHLININFNKLTTCNKLFLFNIPNLIDDTNEIFNEYDDNRKFNINDIFIVYNNDDVNDFNLFLNNYNGKNVKINNLIKNVPDIFYIIKCCIKNSEILDYNYNQVYINPIINGSSIMYEGKNYFNQRNVQLRDGINKNIMFDELELFSSYWDEGKQCQKGNMHKTKPCIYFPQLTDHSGFLVRFWNGKNIIKFLSVNIAEYQESVRGTGSMLLDKDPDNYFYRIKDIIYLLIKILKKEDIEFCLIQELFKISTLNKTNTLCDSQKNKIFLFIKNYLNLYDYDILDDIQYNNNIIYKKNYEVLIEHLISQYHFTSILIGNTSICSIKLEGSINPITATLYLLCISATIFNSHENSDKIIIMGDLNKKKGERLFKFFDKDTCVLGNGPDHSIIIFRENMLNFINKLDFKEFFGAIINYINQQLSNENPSSSGRFNDALNPTLECRLLYLTKLQFKRFSEVLQLAQISPLKDELPQDRTAFTYFLNKYKFLISIFSLCNYFLSLNYSEINVSSFVNINYFHDFSTANNLVCLFDNVKVVNFSYLWQLLTFMYNYLK